MNGFFKKYCSRALNRLYTAIMILRKERRYPNDSPDRVKYLFFAPNQVEKKVLAVGFPAFAGDRKSPKYNFVRTLRDVNIHKLFLLDDIGGIDKGNFLIKPGVEENVRSLIQKKIDELHPEKLIFFGSSKGGYSACNFSLMFPNVYVCIASPAYFVGDYCETYGKSANLKAMLGGDDTDEAKEKLNDRLRNKISDAVRLPSKVYIHYSTEEHMYREHVKDLLMDLRARGVEIAADVSDYPNHADCRSYFPEFLKASIRQILNNT